MLIEFSISDFEELGIPALQTLKIILRLERLKTNESYLLLPLSSSEVIEWLKVNELTCNLELLKTKNICGDLLCLLTKSILMVDLSFSESTAQNLIDIREKQMINRSCLRFLLGKKLKDKNIYELVRRGVSPDVLLNYNKFLSKVEQIFVANLPPKLLHQELRDFEIKCKASLYGSKS